MWVIESWLHKILFFFNPEGEKYITLKYFNAKGHILKILSKSQFFILA